MMLLEEIIDYSSCPMKYSLATEHGRSTTQEGVLEQAIKDGIAQYFISQDRGRSKTIRDSVEAYRATFKAKEHLLKDSAVKTFDIFNHGIVVMQNMDVCITKNNGQPAFGSPPGTYAASVRIEDVVVVADVLGVGKLSLPGDRERSTFVIDVGKPSTNPTPKDIVKHGYWHYFLSNALKDVAGPKKILYVDIESTHTHIVDLELLSRKYFEYVVRHAVRGITAESFLAWPEKTKCRVCPYLEKCDGAL
jgi:hypothetical protein